MDCFNNFYVFVSLIYRIEFQCNDINKVIVNFYGKVSNIFDVIKFINKIKDRHRYSIKIHQKIPFQFQGEMKGNCQNLFDRKDNRDNVEISIYCFDNSLFFSINLRVIRISFVLK